MPMNQNGLGKLAEECGEVIQVVGKLIQYPLHQLIGSFPHPDGTYLRERLEDELADVLAAISFVIEKLNLRSQTISKRKHEKLELFRKWDKEKEG